MVLAPDQMRIAAELNLRNGQFDRALAFADALLVRDPNDVAALLIRASVLREKQQYAQARAAASSAWKYATTDGQKYTAALLMAQALSSDDKRTRAQLWLRRAAQVAPTKQHKARAARDFKHVQQRNPWQTNLSFTIAPNSNINNGSARDRSVLLYEILSPLAGGEPFEVELGTTSKAISGIETGLDLQTRYRFHQTSNSAHDLRARLSYKTYQLSGSSKDDLREDDVSRVENGEEPRNITGSDFAYGTLQLGYGYKKLRSDRRGEFSLTADLGQSFYGGARYNSYLRTNVSQSYYATKTAKLTLGLSSDIRRAQRGSDQHLLTLSTGMSRRLSSGDGLYLGASISTLNSGTERLEYDEVRLRTGYVLGREVMGTALSFGLGTSYRDYDVSPHDPSGRRDFQVSADITATFKNIDYMGFNPTVSFTASKTNSNIGLYDVNRTGISIGIASSF
ncbi:surface lipoprotein assembly modifier [Sulfitobacter sp. HNIBRBA2951]|uniref:surface lipoprotein assembly modifier n=1 Tax=Sulfitobacter aquimarinus TaxID=3158557 RepID=UPI0032DF27AA